MWSAELSSALGELFEHAREVAIDVCWLGRPDRPLLALGSHRRLPAASVLKVAILALFLQDVQEGRASLDEEVVLGPDDLVGGAGVLFELEPERSYRYDELCRLMMVVSDNSASNALLRRVTPQRLNAFAGDLGLEFECGRYFMELPGPGADNFMTASAATGLLHRLYNEGWLRSDLRGFALGCLRRQQYREKVPGRLPEAIAVGHKTGELEGVRHDAAVIETAAPYSLVVLTAEGGEPWLVDAAIARFSRALFDRLLQLETEQNF